MKCRQIEPLVESHADGEAHALLRRSIERHLGSCARCAARHAEVRALRSDIARQVPYFAAPRELETRVRAMVEAVRASAPRARNAPSKPLGWLAGGALAGIAATMFAWTVGTTLVASRFDDHLATEAVAAHVRATLGHELIQVASSDRHTVKPWLSARLDFSPPVRDLASEGFPLRGGRLDSIDQRPVAALVYRHGEHTIDVFVCPRASLPASSQLRTVRGFNVAHVRGASMDWVAVSDVEPDVLSAFVQRLADADIAE